MVRLAVLYFAVVMCFCVQAKLRVNGPADPSQRLPNTLSLSLRGLQSSAALQQLSGELAASAGAACHSVDGASVSAVLVSMKVGWGWNGGVGVKERRDGRWVIWECCGRSCAS